MMFCKYAGEKITKRIIQNRDDLVLYHVLPPV